MPDPMTIAEAAAAARTAATRLAGQVVHTPLRPYAALSRRTGATVVMKCENEQHTGSFKFRGGWSAISALDPDIRAKGVIAFSSGLQPYANRLRPASEAKEAIAWGEDLEAIGGTGDTLTGIASAAGWVVALRAIFVSASKPLRDEFGFKPRRGGLMLTIKDSPLARGERADRPLCDYYSATFERIFRELVCPHTRVTEISCTATGASACCCSALARPGRRLPTSRCTCSTTVCRSVASRYWSTMNSWA